MIEAKSSVSSQPYHPVTRWLHAGLVLGVIFQLICAAQMVHPEHAGGEHGEAMTSSETATAHHLDRVNTQHSMATAHAVNESGQQLAQDKNELGESFMTAHRSGGLLVALIVLANFIWAIVLRGVPRKRQVAVLFSVSHWHEAWLILRQLCLMIIGKGSLPEPGNALSLIVEMLGMLTMTAMAVSGVIVWSVWAGPSNAVTEYAEVWMGVHGSVAILLFLYLVGHISMALLHMRAGDRVFARIAPITLKE